MSEERARADARRQRRVRRLKKGIVLALALLGSTPFLLCVFLAVRIRDLNGSIAVLTAKVGLLTEEMTRQQALLQGLMDDTRTVGEGRQEENASGLSLSGDRIAADGAAQTEAEAEADAEEQEALHKVYLTFDDGPSANTEKILDILDDYGVKATFFVVGKESDADKEALRQIVERGHTLGMHSFSHKYA